MKIISITITAFLLGATAFTSIAKADCKFFHEENFAGDGGQVNPNDYVRFFAEKESDGLPLEVRQAKAPVYYGEVVDRDKVASIKLTDGCEALVYHNTSMNSAVSEFKVDTASTKAALAGKAASFFCQCKK